MTLTKTIKAKQQVLKGRMKQGFGRITGNRRSKVRGRTDRVAGSLKQFGGRAKDALKH